MSIAIDLDNRTQASCQLMDNLISRIKAGDKTITTKELLVAHTHAQDCPHCSPMAGAMSVLGFYKLAGVLRSFLPPTGGRCFRHPTRWPH